MLDQLTTEQNLAMPLSLHIETMPGVSSARAGAGLGGGVVVS
jgi:hypothetical protein